MAGPLQSWASPQACLRRPNADKSLRQRFQHLAESNSTVEQRDTGLISERGR